MTKKNPPPVLRVRRRPPPPPGYDQMPPAPEFGWLGNSDDLTLQELDEIALVAQVEISQLNKAALLAYSAVAYARRVDPQLYPWSTAKLLKISDIEVHFEDEGQEEADALQAAIDGVDPG